ncbi:MAG: rod shape-determining protein MreC, partial [bacterium]|nr:rod shape-determining protein MreC [bacterium]
LDQNECSGVIKGLGDFNLLLDLIPLEKEVSPGDIIVTSCLGGIFPDNLLVGEVKKVEKTDIESFQQADIEPIFDLSKSRNVFIILDF